jgi:hypothetical protein
VHKYERLEKLYYKRKLLKIFLFIFLAVLIILISLIFIFSYGKKSKNNSFKSVPKEFNNTKQKYNTVYKNNKIKIESNFTKKTTFKSKIDKNFTQVKVIKKESNKKNINENNSTFPMFTFIMPKIDLNVTIKKLKKNANSNIKKIKSEKKLKKPSLIIEESINVTDLIRNFNNNPSFDLAIQIANYYLKKNYLNLAKKWALRANSIKPERYESWKIFAIILLKRNEKEKAKEVLKTYLNDYGQNDEIEKLLRSIDE